VEWGCGDSAKNSVSGRQERVMYLLMTRRTVATLLKRHFQLTHFIYVYTHSSSRFAFLVSQQRLLAHILPFSSVDFTPCCKSCTTIYFFEPSGGCACTQTDVLFFVTRILVPCILSRLRQIRLWNVSRVVSPNKDDATCNQNPLLYINLEPNIHHASSDAERKRTAGCCHLIVPTVVIAPRHSNTSQPISSLPSRVNVMI